MRWGELAGLCDDAIDDDLRTVRVLRTVVTATSGGGFIAASHEPGGTTASKPFNTEPTAVACVAEKATGGLRFHDRILQAMDGDEDRSE